MKKWARVLIWIGVIWVFLVLVGLVFFYFQLRQLQTQMLNSEQVTNLSNIVSLVDMHLSSFFLYFIELGVPAWILFLISFIFGREKRLK